MPAKLQIHTNQFKLKSIAKHTLKIQFTNSNKPNTHHKINPTTTEITKSIQTHTTSSQNKSKKQHYTHKNQFRQAIPYPNTHNTQTKSTINVT
jgi:hypothetical protein